MVASLPERTRNMAPVKKLTAPRKEVLTLQARVVALEVVQVLTLSAVAALAKTTSGSDLRRYAEQVRAQHLDHLKEEMTPGMSELERRFLAEEIDRRIAQGLKLLGL